MKKVNLSKVINDQDLSLIRIDLESIILNPDKRIYITFTDGEKIAGVEIDEYEASLLCFVNDGLHKNAHINTIHQLFVKFLKQVHVDVESVCIESKNGDVIYASLKTVDVNHNRSFAIVSLCDAVILAKISNAPIFILPDVWEDMDEVDEWDYQEYIIDFDSDEDEE